MTFASNNSNSFGGAFGGACCGASMPSSFALILDIAFAVSFFVVALAMVEVCVFGSVLLVPGLLIIALILLSSLIIILLIPEGRTHRHTYG